MTSREQGDYGEMAAMEWFSRQGAHVYVPVGRSPDCDFVADLDGALMRVEVKTSSSFHRGRWSVAVCTKGGNQSWSGVTKLFDTSRCDYLFVCVADGRRWCIPCHAMEGRRELLLAGPKYSEFEVERGLPFPERPEMALAF